MIASCLILLLALVALESTSGTIIGANQESPLAILVDTLYWSNNRGRNIKKIMQAGVDNGVSLDIQNDQGWAPMHFAVAYDSLDAVKVFLEHGADANQAENDQWTPLHFAAFHGNDLIASILLKSGADPLLRNRAGLLPSSLSLNEGHTKLAATLAEAAYARAQDLASPAPVEQQEADGDYDCEAGIDFFLLLDLLRDAKAHPSSPINANMVVTYTSGHSPLTVASCRGDVDAVRELVEMGSNLHYTNARSGRSVLHYAVGSGSTETVREVLSLLAGAEVETGAATADGAGVSPLALAKKNLEALPIDGGDAEVAMQREARRTILEALQRAAGLPTETEQSEQREAKRRLEEEARLQKEREEEETRRRVAEQKKKTFLAP